MTAVYHSPPRHVYLFNRKAQPETVTVMVKDKLTGVYERHHSGGWKQSSKKLENNIGTLNTEVRTI